MSFRAWSAAVHRALNLVILLATPMQFYTAGLVMFGASGFGPHRVAGSLLILAGLLSLLAALAAGRHRARPMPALWLFVLLFLQPVLAFAPRTSAPAVAALHAVNGLFILMVAAMIERRQLTARPEAEGALDQHASLGTAR